MQTGASIYTTYIRSSFLLPVLLTKHFNYASANIRHYNE